MPQRRNADCVSNSLVGRKVKKECAIIRNMPLCAGRSQLEHARARLTHLCITIIFGANGETWAKKHLKIMEKIYCIFLFINNMLLVLHVCCLWRTSALWTRMWPFVNRVDHVNDCMCMLDIVCEIRCTWKYFNVFLFGINFCFKAKTDIK